MNTWLDVHVVTGLAGSVLVLFHSAFQLRTAIATTTALSLTIVVVTGLVGFYLNALLPRSGLKALKERLAELEPLLPGLTGHVRESVERVPCTRLAANASFLATVWTVPRWLLEARARHPARSRPPRRPIGPSVS